ncbi:MAG: helix-turn-helix domain-containing protein, partial [Planctomycetota bacterium]
MHAEKRKGSTAFGRQLKIWRQKRGMSQLELATAACTTPRHLSFVESGRSRPGKELVLRLARSLDLPVRNQNELLIAAGLPAQFTERELTDQQIQPFRMAVEQIIESHNPFPACVHDGLGRVLTCNDAHRRMAPGSEKMSPEELVDMMFAPGPMRDSIENWAEVAWAWVDRQLLTIANTNNQELSELVNRAMRYLDGVERPVMAKDASAPEMMIMRFRFGDQLIRTFSTVMCFESALEVTLSELRV